VTARDEAMAPIAAAAAAIRNNEQKIRRHLNGVKVDVGFGFVIIELTVALIWLLVNGKWASKKTRFNAGVNLPFSFSVVVVRTLICCGARLPFWSGMPF
jgi:hypothetical protein